VRKLDIEFDGLMELLGRRLYSDQRVFIRELIQNSHDAIAMRQRVQSGFPEELT
jgi:molecular chaperone HtpG